MEAREVRRGQQTRAAIAGRLVGSSRSEGADPALVGDVRGQAVTLWCILVVFCDEEMIKMTGDV